MKMLTQAKIFIDLPCQNNVRAEIVRRTKSGIVYRLDRPLIYVIPNSARRQCGDVIDYSEAVGMIDIVKILETECQYHKGVVLVWALALYKNKFHPIEVFSCAYRLHPCIYV